ncbi:MAG: OsmC family protein [Rothia sp. (in: high G+C Gram-positive bacteria)]|nr:OsmC family protein [Rothia sp. (in: high G+C Gram-positive bacteria)]
MNTSDKDTVANPDLKSVQVERIAPTHYRATNAAGASVEFGQGEGLITPVEMLLAAVAGCSAIDVDVVTSRRSEPEKFSMHAQAHKIHEDGGAVRLDDVQVNFNIRFPQDAAGAQAQAMIDRLLKISHDKDCTVSRTVEHPTTVALNNVSEESGQK